MSGLTSCRFHYIGVGVDAVAATHRFISREEPLSKMVSHIGAEIVFTMPDDEPQNLCRFFNKLDKHLPELGISTYGVSETTLEEVYTCASQYPLLRTT